MKILVEIATQADIPAWLELAAEVGDLFGADMAHDPAFRETLQRNIARGSAFCVRLDAEFAGAMLFRNGWIHWLGVKKHFRRRGAGRALVSHAVKSSEGEVRVVTFGANHPHPDARSAQELYRVMGLALSDETPAAAADGTPRVILLWRAVS